MPLIYGIVVMHHCSKKLNSLHRRAVKLILPLPFLTTDQKLHSLKFLPLKQHLYLNKAVLMHKVINKKVSPYLHDLIFEQQLNVRTQGNRIGIPRPRIDLFKSCISYSGSSLWNSLPSFLKLKSSTGSFRRELTRLLFSGEKRF